MADPAILVQLSTFEGGRRVVRTLSTEVARGAQLDRLQVVTGDGLVLLSIPFSLNSYARGDDDDLDDDLDDADGAPPAGVRGPRGFCGHESPDRGDGVFWACEKPTGHVGWHAAAHGRMGWP